MQLKIHWSWLVPVLLVTTFLGSVLLTEDALWFDEWVTYFLTNTGGIGNNPDYLGTTTVAGLPCGDLLGDQTFNPLHMICMAAIDNSWPPLFFGLMMFWDLFSGGAYFFDRTLALFIGLIGVSATYQMATNLFDKKIGLVTALLLGTSVFFTFYLHEVRGYTLYVLMPAINGWLYWRLLNNPDAGRGLRWGFVLSIIGTLYTHYVGIGVIFGIGVYHLLIARPDNIVQRLKSPESENDAEANHWVSILKLYVNGCLVYGLWVAVLFISFFNESLTNRSESPIDLLWTMVRGFSNDLWYIALPLIAISLVRWQKREVQFLWIWGISILFVAIVANLAADFLFHPRHVIGLMPIFMTLIAVGLSILAQRFTWAISLILVVAWAGVGIWYGLSTDFMNNLPRHVDAVPLTVMETIVDTSETCATENDTFIMAWNITEEEWVQDHIISYYLYDSPARTITVSRIVDDATEENLSHLIPEEIILSGVDARYDYFVDGAERVFLFALPNDDLTENIVALQTLLEADGYFSCEFIRSDNLIADIYVRNADQCDAVINSCMP